MAPSAFATALLLALSFLAPSSAAAVAEDMETRIVGGTEVSPKFIYPWLAVLTVQGIPICGGTLIDPNYILTASHCSYSAPAADLIVHLHRHDLSKAEEEGVSRTVEKVIMHPDFSSSTLVYDYALWKLSSPVESIEPVTLDTTGTYQIEGNDVLVMGWGATSYRGPSSSVLLETTLKIWNFQQCSNQWQGGLSPSIQMCAGVALGGKDTCQGDSGGPIFAYGTNSSLIQIGVVSFGDECGNPNSPGIYSYVYGGLDFIDLAKNDSRTNRCSTNPCPSNRFCIESIDTAFCAGAGSFLAPLSFFSVALFAIFFSFFSF